MSQTTKIAFKPELSEGEQQRQRHLIGAWADSKEAMAPYGPRLKEWIPLDWDLKDFMRVFPEMVRDEFAIWRRENLDTRDERAGPEWRCFPVGNEHGSSEVWVELPRDIKVSVLDHPDKVRTFIMRGEMWTQDHSKDRALGTVFWLTLRAKTTGILACLGCEDVMSEQPALESYFWVIRGMLDGNLQGTSQTKPLLFDRSAQELQTQGKEKLLAWIETPLPRRPGNTPRSNLERFAYVYLWHHYGKTSYASKEDFCYHSGLSRTSLTDYERELEAEGIKVYLGMPPLPEQIRESLKAAFPSHAKHFR